MGTIQQVVLLRPRGKAVRSCLHPRNIRPPFMLKYIEAGLKKSALSCLLLDEYLHTAPPGIFQRQSDFLVISVMTPDAPRAIALIHEFRKHSQTATVIACGQDPTCRPGFYSGKGVDFIAFGEAELAIAELIRNLTAGSGGIPAGIRTAETVKLIEPLTVNNLDLLPTPEYSETEISGYRFYYPLNFAARLSYGHVLFSRGCPGNCIFCTQIHRESWGKVMRYHSIDRMVAEIRSLVNLGVNFLLFDDDNFGLDRSIHRELFQRLKIEGLNLPWQCHTRVENLDDEILRFYAGHNCRLLRIGAESGSAKVLRDIGKTSSPKSYLNQCRRVFAFSRKLGMDTLFLAMIGCPGERTADMLATARLIHKVKPSLLQISFFTVYPNSVRNDEQHHPGRTASPPASAFHYRPQGKSFSLSVIQAFMYLTFYLNP
ncbi:MAG: radical SAM protein, partial [Candidatus Wallbacteria bacterium]|nr:radical SAM protein [Candidatus Wallbacteria bacterium]